MKHLMIATSTLLLPVLVGCAQSQHATQSSASKNVVESEHDPVAFGKKFKTVCRVGEKGGDGVLIERQWVLTAAHVAVGIYRREKGRISVYFGSTKYSVKYAFVHPEFKPMGQHDIALLFLESEVKDCEPNKIYRDSDELGLEIVIAGHGDKRDDKNRWIRDGKLRAFTNKIDSTTDLRVVFDYDGPEGDPTAREGAGGPGDSGGPAFIEKDGSYLVAGISSMGRPGAKGPATFGAIEYFVRVSKFQEWIDQTMKKTDPKLALNLADLKKFSGGQGTVVRQEAGAGTGRPDFSQAKNARTAKRFVSAFENYDEAKMVQTIKECFSDTTLQNTPANNIPQHWPALFRQLRSATVERVISESAEQIILNLKKGDDRFRLRIRFDPKQPDKISDLMFGKLQ